MCINDNKIAIFGKINKYGNRKHLCANADDTLKIDQAKNPGQSLNEYRSS